MFCCCCCFRCFWSFMDYVTQSDDGESGGRMATDNGKEADLDDIQY